MKKYTLRHFNFSLLLAVFVTFASSCSFVDVPVKEYFKEYTENAAIEKADFDTTLVNPQNIYCLSSDTDHKIDLLLRNPQEYSLNFGYKFKNSDIQEEFSANFATSGVLFTQSADKMNCTLTFSKEFLYKIDYENIGEKALLGEITLEEPKSGRTFQSYSLNAISNIAPPEVLGTTVLIYIDSSNKQTYFLCFNLPDFTGTVHEKDTKTLVLTETVLNGTKLENQTRELDIETIRSGSVEGFSTSVPATGTLTISSGGDFVPETNGYTPIWYSTNLPLQSDNIFYSLVIRDDYGLTSSSLVGNHTPKLEKPLIKDENGLVFDEENSYIYEVDEETGFGTVIISESGKANYYAIDSETSEIKIEKSETATGATINWKAYECSSSPEVLYSSGTAVEKAEIKLPKGKYRIEAFESKLYYVDSNTAKTKDAGVIMKVTPKYYVSSSGDDANTGKFNWPFRTIQKAIDEIEAEADEDSGIIYLLSDIQLESDYEITLQSTSGIGTKNYTIEGYKAKKKFIPASGKSIIRKTDTAARDLALKNLILSGCEVSNVTGGAVYYETGSLSLENCEVTDNTLTINNGNEICSAICAYVLNMKDCIISKNKCIVTGTCSDFSPTVGGLQVTVRNTQFTDNITDISAVTSSSLTIEGAALYADYTKNLEFYGDITVTGNNIIKTGYAGTLDNRGAVYSYFENKYTMLYEGKKIIADNYVIDGDKKIPNNLYLNRKIITHTLINIQGNISGSKIGVTVRGVPTYSSPIKFTQNFSNSGQAKPSAIFTSDQGYMVGIFENEAGLFVSSGNIGVETYEDVEIQCLTSVISDIANATETNRTVRFKVLNKSTGEDVTSSANFSFKVKYFGAELGSPYFEITSDSVIFAANVGVGDYYIIVTATVNGATYSSTHAVKVD